jgi:hypothetical protein
VAAGGDVNVADTHGHTPLMALVQFRHGDYLERAKVLLEHPALDLDARGLPWDLRKVMYMYMYCQSGLSNATSVPSGFLVVFEKRNRV